MKKFTILKNKRIYHIDNFLKNKFSKKLIFGQLKVPGIPYFMYPINTGAVNYVDFYYPGRGIKMLIIKCSKNGDTSNWFLNRKEYIKLGEKAIYDGSFIKKTIKNHREIEKKFYNFIAKLEKNGINTNKLLESYLELIKIYIAEWGIAYGLTGPIPHGYSDVLSGKLLNKYKFSNYIKDAINIFTKSEHNFLQDEAEDLNKIISLVGKHCVNIWNLGVFKKQHPDIYKKLENHQKKYYWIANNYQRAIYLDKKYFFNKIREVLSHGSLKNKEIVFKQKLAGIRKNINKKDIILLKRLGIAATLQDKRKKINLIAENWLAEFLKIIAKRIKVSYSTLQFASQFEILDLLTEQSNIKKIAARKNGCINICFKRREYWLTGREYKLFKNKITLEKAVLEGNIIQGVVANPGKITGRARIILNVSKDSKKMKKGDIIVASMTRPEFMPILRFAGAIVTNEGGITSHAVVISREMNIPCIVGTKIATDVLKDGDLVEVDANKGIVKILKK